MRINQNIAALNAWRNLTGTDNATNKSLERLSSGFRINKAADDAAGLAISEKMRGQISGLRQAQRNASDGISLIQTAEGSLQETTSILQRMRELAVQSSSDTLTDTDRAEIQKEVSNLKLELDRIANTTEFNTKKILNGNVAEATTAAATKLQSIKFEGGTASAIATGATALANLKDENGNSLGLALNDVIKVDGIKNGTAVTQGSFTITSVTADWSTADAESDTVAGTIRASVAGTSTLQFTVGGVTYTTAALAAATADSTLLTAVASDLQTKMNAALGGGSNITVTVEGSNPAMNFKITDAQGRNVQITGGTADAVAIFQTGGSGGTAQTLDNLAAQIKSTLGITSGSVTIDSNGRLQILGDAGTANALAGVKLSATNRTLFNNKVSAFEETQAAADTQTDQSLNLHIGANDSQSIKVGIKSMTLQALALSSVNVSTQQGGSTAITVLDNGLTKVSSERANLGALQNRLDYTIRNLGTAAENLAASESRIRDADMALEMTVFTRNQILIQAGTAMLAQANQKTQAVLQLLR